MKMKCSTVPQMCTRLWPEHLVNTANVQVCELLLRKCILGKWFNVQMTFSQEKALFSNFSSLVVSAQLTIQSLITFTTEYIRGPKSCCEQHWWFSSEDWNEHVKSLVQTSKETVNNSFIALILHFLVSSLALKFECQEKFIIKMPGIQMFCKVMVRMHKFLILCDHRELKASGRAVKTVTKPDCTLLDRGKQRALQADGHRTRKDIKPRYWEQKGTLNNWHKGMFMLCRNERKVVRPDHTSYTEQSIKKPRASLSRREMGEHTDADVHSWCSINHEWCIQNTNAHNEGKRAAQRAPEGEWEKHPVCADQPRCSMSCVRPATHHAALVSSTRGSWVTCRAETSYSSTC